MILNNKDTPEKPLSSAVQQTRDHYDRDKLLRNSEARFEEALAAEKELAQVILRSIGDAVITTDASGRVQYLNPVAESLTGWSQAEAQGESLLAVFKIIHETTRQPATDPMICLLHETPTSQLAGHAALIARDGTEISIEESAMPLQAQDGRLMGAVVVFHDVSKTRQLTQQLSWQASHDVLTRLLNRKSFECRVMQAVDSAHSEHKVHALCYIDLDNFKIVNDTCGHAAGDRLLEQVSALMGECVRTTDVLARLGGDEFGLLLEFCPLEHAARLVDELKERLQALRFNYESRIFSVGVSIGVTAITATTDSAATAMSNADAACYVAKRKGRNRVHIHQLDDAELARERGEIQWAAYIAEALEANRFQLYYQPILSLNPACLEGGHYEVLLRLCDQSGAIASPAAFIPAAERYNLMPQIDRWVIQTLFATRASHCQQVWTQFQVQPAGGSHLYSINLSGASIDDDEFIHFLKAQFLRYQVPPALICFEITETAAIANLPKAVQFIGELRQLGCQFALDDFGSGMSSFGYLKTLPIDYLKIDGCFIQNIVDDKIDLAMVTAIHQIAQVMNIRTVAEFVENEDILTTLKGLGIDYAQGYSIARPAPLLASTTVSDF
ncbi:MAG: EAL domain-containing protein [Phormidesmis sp.]